MDIAGKKITVTGGSRGLGLGIVEALVEREAIVTVVARASRDLETTRNRLGVGAIAADIRDRAAADVILAQVQPDVVVLNAGAKLPMAHLDQISWEDFTAPWHDVKAGLHWLQVVLNQPMRPGGRVLVVSSGAAVAGSPMSGGYGGAKRMLWFMARYANRVSERRDLGLRFQTVLPRQMVLGTGIGDHAAGAYATAMGISPEAFVARFGAAMPPQVFGRHVADVLQDLGYDESFAFGLNGDEGVTVMERLTD